MRLVVAIALVALALPASAQDASSRYAIEFSIYDNGVEVTAARTVIAESGQANVVLTGADGEHVLVADLQPEQGDGDDDKLVLMVYLSHDGRDLANPTLTMKRGGSAQMRIGTEGRDRTLTDGIEIEVSPLRP
jgi:hypothetical protein